MTAQSGPSSHVRPPAGMCGSTKVCEECPSHFLCAMKAGNDSRGEDYSPEILSGIRAVGGPLP